jgi:hypothetical protein
MAIRTSLLEDARREFPGCSDLECIERVAARIIEELDERPPISLEVVASYRDIATVKLEPLPFAGSLTPESSGLVMRLNSRDDRRRRRFSGFHEVGHTFQPGYLQQTLFRCNPPYSVQTAPHPEQLADTAAAELLLPRRYFEFDLAESEPGWNGVINLAKTYDASLHATALRTVQLSDCPVLMIILEPGFRRSERSRLDAVPKLRVTSSISRGDFPFIPRNKSASQVGALHRALHGEDVEGTASLLDELSIPGDRLHVSARLFPYADEHGEFHKRVMALFWPMGEQLAA